MAFERLYRWVGPQLTSYAAAHGIQHTAAFTNDVILDVFDRLPDFHGDGAAFRAWVFAVAGNRLVAERQAAPATPPAGPMARALSALSDAQREVVLLRLIVGLELAHVAAALNKPITAIKALELRGLQTLQSDLLEREHGGSAVAGMAFVLSDEVLEGLLTGAVDGNDERFAGNPVAAWFLSAHRVPFAEPPVPDRRLLDLFASIPSNNTPSNAIVSNATVSNATASNDTPSDNSVSRSAIAGFGVAGAPTAASAQIVAPAPTMTSAPTAALPAVGNGTAPARTGSIGFTDNTARPEMSRPFAVAPVQTYRTPVTGVVAGALRPTPTKGLILVSLALITFIASQLLGADSETAVLPASSASTVLATSSSTTVAPVRAAPVSPSASESTTTTTVVTRPAPTAAPTTPAPTLSTTTPTFIDSSTSETPTTPVSVSSSETTPTQPTTSAPETTVTPTSTPSTIPDPTVTTTPTTAPTITQPVTVRIPSGVVLSVPADAPPGTYSAQVASIIGCTVEVTQGSGSRAVFEAGLGNTISFQLTEGSLFVTSAGCPQTYRLS